MYRNKIVAAVIVAAGASQRMGFDKLLYRLDGETVIVRTVAAFNEHPLIDEIVVVAGENEPQLRAELGQIAKLSKIVRGGATRAESVKKGLAALLQNDGLVAIQDGARPFVSTEVITRVIEKASEMGGAAPAVAVKDTIKVVDAAHCVRSTPPRGMLYAVQTPQVFDIALYRIALEQLDDELITDDCGVFERAGYTVKLTEGDYANLKITTVEDLPITVKENTAMRIGHGYDVHRLVEGRELILGGVKVEYEKGLLGHSDADVLTHAIMDALLGAAALGDIGKQFPDSDDAYTGADSIALLCRVEELVRCEGYSIENVDATILCQKPKLAPAIPAMRERLATAMKLTVNAVSVKATTEEMLGFTGRGEGIAAHAVCLLSMR